MIITPEQLKIIDLVATIGLNAAETFLIGIKNAATIDDAIKAVQDAQKVGWEDAKIAPVK